MSNQKLKVTRTLGYEIEGFVYDNEDISISFADVGWDGSLSHGEGDAIEVRTEPTTNLNRLEHIYDELIRENFNINNTCGLHIHVDIEDYTVKDKAKLLRFGAGIELLMFALQDSSRYYGIYDDCEEDREYNGFCRKIHHSWRKLFRDSFISQPIPFNTFDTLDELCAFISENSELTNRCWNGKYQWLNANVEYYPTVEFRIFNATEDHEEAQAFGMLAYHIVETVKNSTVKQLSFIIRSIYEGKSLDEMYSRLFDSIGLDNEFRPQIKNERLANYIYDKFCLPNQEQIEEAI